MRRVELSSVRGESIASFGSRGFDALAFLPRARVTVCRLDAGGVIGRHAAPVDQLLVVLSGSGQVTHGDVHIAVAAGETILFEAGDDHETVSPHGLTAVVLECPGLADQL